MTKSYNFPESKKFAFTIVDDTDGATNESVKEIYNYLYELKVFTTKTIWVYPSRDKFKGQSLQDDAYLSLINEISDRGFEIALHGVGSGNFSREEVLAGIEFFKNNIGYYPKIHVNHSSDSLNNVYWGSKRFCYPFNKLLYHFYPLYSKDFQGEVEGSPFFWGDKHKEVIKFTRNHDFNNINTLKVDPYTPYIDKKKLSYSNFWFSSTYAAEPVNFNNVVTYDSIDELERENGVAILFCHLANFYKKRSRKLDPGFKSKMEYISKKDGWFVPASTLLEFLLNEKQSRNENLYLLPHQEFKLSLFNIMSRLNYLKQLRKRFSRQHFNRK